MFNISFMFKVPHFDNDNNIGKIYFSPNESIDKIYKNDVNSLYEILKSYVLRGINLYRKNLRIMPISNVNIGILGTTELNPIDSEKQLFKLYIKYNNQTNNYDYYYDGNLLE